MNDGLPDDDAGLAPHDGGDPDSGPVAVDPDGGDSGAHEELDAGGQPLDPESDSGAAITGEGWGFESVEDLEAFTVLDPDVVAARAWHPADDHASSGHISVTTPFTGEDQIVHFRITPPSPVNMAGRTLKVRMKHLSGTGPGAAQAFAQSGDAWVWTSGPSQELIAMSDFTVLSLDFGATSFPEQIVRYGLQIHSHDGGADNTHHFVIDAIWID